MSTVYEIYKLLDSLIPPSLSCEWDNDGVMCMPDADRTVSGILLTLDITSEAIDYAEQNQMNVIISHHPLVFRPIKGLSALDYVGKRLVRLTENGISAFSFHTRLDAASGGVNDALAEKLGLTDAEPFGPDGEKIGRIGYVKPSDLDAFANVVKERLDCPNVTVSDAGNRTHRVAVLGGAGKDYVISALKSGADSYVTGEMDYNSLLDSREMGLNVILAGHFHTENPVLEKLKNMIENHIAGEKINIDIFDCSKIKYS